MMPINSPFIRHYEFQNGVIHSIHHFVNEMPSFNWKWLGPYSHSSSHLLNAIAPQRISLEDGETSIMAFVNVFTFIVYIIETFFS